MVQQEIHDLLVRWAIWARGPYFDRHFKLLCRSLEHKYAGPLGNVYTGMEDVLRASVRRAEVTRDSDMLAVERAVMKLPEKHRTAVRLHYVVHKRLPMVQKFRILGCRENEYELLVTRGALMVWRGLCP